MVSLGQKLKIQKGAKNDCTSKLELLCPKDQKEKTLYSKKESILKKAKIGHDANALYPLQNNRFRSKTKNTKNMPKIILQEHKTCSVQETAPNHTKYSRNQTILKTSHH